MATLSAFPSCLPLCRSCRQRLPSSALSFSSLSLSSSYSPSFIVSLRSKTTKHRSAKISRAVAEEAAPDGGDYDSSPKPVSEQTEAVSVPVSPSDILTMFVKAEGTMDESSVPAVSKALEDLEGISDLKVQVLEGIASVELIKQTTVQATGVASNIVEVIQGSGFKLQTLNLSFEDEEDAA